jgi:DNA-binding transcriptional LysR family regulator
VLEILETAETALGRRRASVSGLVRLGVTTAFGLYLTNRINELLTRHPDLSIELIMRDGFGDLVEEGLDLAIRVGDIAEGSLIARKLGSVRWSLVMSTRHFSPKSALEHPRDLTNQPCVVFTYGGGRQDWHFFNDGEESVVAPATAFRANSSEAALHAIQAGVGIGLLPEFHARGLLNAGELAEVLPEWVVPSMPLYAVHTGPRTLPLRTRTVLDFLIEISSEVLASPD